MATFGLRNFSPWVAGWPGPWTHSDILAFLHGTDLRSLSITPKGCAQRWSGIDMFTRMPIRVARTKGSEFRLPRDGPTPINTCIRSRLFLCPYPCGAPGVNFSSRVHVSLAPETKHKTIGPAMGNSQLPDSDTTKIGQHGDPLAPNVWA